MQIDVSCLFFLFFKHHWRDYRPVTDVRGYVFIWTSRRGGLKIRLIFYEKSVEWFSDSAKNLVKNKNKIKRAKKVRFLFVFVLVVRKYLFSISNLISSKYLQRKVYIVELNRKNARENKNGFKKIWKKSKKKTHEKKMSEKSANKCLKKGFCRP